MPFSSRTSRTVPPWSMALMPGRTSAVSMIPSNSPSVTVAPTDGKQILNSDHILGFESVPKSLVVIGSGAVDVAVACGVELMSRIPIGSNSSKKLGLGVPIPKTYFEQYEMTSQFEGAERIADKWGVTRDDTDAFGFASQQRAAQAWAEDRFAGQYVTVEAPDVDESGSLSIPTRSTRWTTAWSRSGAAAGRNCGPRARPRVTRCASSQSTAIATTTACWCWRGPRARPATATHRPASTTPKP